MIYFLVRIGVAFYFLLSITCFLGISIGFAQSKLTDASVSTEASSYTPHPHYLFTFSRGAHDLKETLYAHSLQVGEAVQQIIDYFLIPSHWPLFVLSLLKITSILVLGLLGRWGVYRLWKSLPEKFLKIRTVFQNSEKNQILSKVGLRSGGLLGYILGFFLGFFLIASQKNYSEISLVLGLGVFIHQLIAVGLKTIFEPHNPSQRLISLSEVNALQTYRYLRSILLYLVYGFTFGNVLLVLRLDPILSQLIFKIVIVLSVLKSVRFCTLTKKAVTLWMREQIQKESKLFKPLLTFLTHIWSFGTIFYLLIITFTFLSAPTQQYVGLTLSFVFTTSVLMITLYFLVRFPEFIRHLLHAPFLPWKLNAKRAKFYTNLLSLGLDTLLGLLALFTLSEIWGWSWVTKTLSMDHAEFFIKIFCMILIITFSLFCWEIFEYALENFLHHYIQSSPAATTRGRIKTLTPVFKNGFRVILGGVTLLILFAELGLNIMPFIAGASVVGIALSLGGQTLVKDIITGTFILIEDTMNIGDFITLGQMSGEVESMSLRTVHLRDSSGYLHIIPFSTIGAFTNMTRNYVNCILDLQFSYHEDMEKVKGLIFKVYEEMVADPEKAKDILEPLEVMGIQSFGTYGVVWRLHMKVLPNTQWSLSRCFRTALKAAFDQNGIHFPYPQQTIQLTGSPLFAPLIQSPPS